MPKLSFDAEKHEYKIDGLTIPSYSQVAQDLGLVDYSCVRKEDLEYKQAVGRAVHLAIFYHNKNILKMDSLEGDVALYFQSWFKFVELYQPTILTEYSENPICSFQWKYGVMPDLVVAVKGGITVIEIKCVSTMNPVTALQTAAQKIALEENYKLKIKQRWGLKLIPGSTPKLTTYTKLSDETTWKSAVNTWAWKKEKGLWKQ